VGHAQHLNHASTGTGHLMSGNEEEGADWIEAKISPILG
jgi:hypothetical protein